MDNTDRKLLTLLATDARRSLADLGAVIGLSPSATNERIRRLVAAGAIRRFTIETDPAVLGLPLLALIWVALAPGADEPRFRAFAQTHPQIEECHHVTGAWSYLLKVRAASLDDVESFLAALKAGGWLARSETMLALSSPVPGSSRPKAAP